MTSEEVSFISSTARRRPLGVTLLTIYFSITAGLVPMALVLFLYFSRWARAEVVIPSYQLILSLALGTTIIVAAAAAWQGRRWAPYVFVAAVSIHYILLAWNNYQAMQSGLIEESRALPRVIRAPLTIALVAWYFLIRAKGFFRP